jgi:predicted CoA-binding protein
MRDLIVLLVKPGTIAEKPDLVNIVTPFETSLKVLRECRTLGLTEVWLQPGALNGEVVSYLEKNGFNYLVDRCTMAESSAHLR